MLSVIVFLQIFCLCQGIFNPTNETDLSRCKVYYSRSGITYKDFFEISPPKRNDTDLRLDFHFTVLAASDAHMLIAPTKNVQKDDPAYEIVIGAGGNTFCDIRRKQKNNVKTSVRIKGLLSAVDVRSFWIHMTNDGVLEVGKEGEELAFISWKDHDPLPTNVISFSTWPGIEAKWFFDCITDDIRRIKRNLTQTDRLRKLLLAKYDPYSRPVRNHSTVTTVNLSPEITGLFVDEYHSILRVHGAADIRWFDEKLKWNKSEYGGLTEIKVSPIEIWKPNIILFNSIEQDITISDITLLTVKNTGEVFWYPSINMKTWCASDNYENWPKDTRKCDLYFVLWGQSDKLEVVYPNKSTPVQIHHFSQWIVEEVEIIVNYGDPRPGSHLSNTSVPPTLDIHLVITRNSNAYSTIFLALYLVIGICTLCIFCVSSTGPAKISLGCFQILLSIACLIYLGTQLPAHSSAVPYIVQLFGHSVIAGVSALVVSILVINLSRCDRQRSFPNILSRVLISRALGKLMCLPQIKKDEYGKLSVTRMRDTQQYYILLGIVIDRICLVVGICLLIYSLYLY